MLIKHIVDDGSEKRGHREQIFNPKYLVYGSFTGFHKAHETITCQHFTGGVSALGSKAALDAKYEEFKAEKVDIQLPPDYKSCSRQTTNSRTGNIATKKIVCTLTMKDDT